MKSKDWKRWVCGVLGGRQECIQRVWSSTAIPPPPFFNWTTPWEPPGNFKVHKAGDNPPSLPAQKHTSPGAFPAFWWVGSTGAVSACWEGELGLARDADNSSRNGRGEGKTHSPSLCHNQAGDEELLSSYFLAAEPKPLLSLAGSGVFLSLNSGESSNSMWGRGGSWEKEGWGGILPLSRKGVERRGDFNLL